MSQLVFDRPIAHRGLHDRAKGVIENSASAFRAAIERRFAIECDLQLTRDGEVVVFHDDNLDRLTPLTGPIAEVEAEMLCKTPLRDSLARDCPLRFVDLLDLVAGRTLLQIELKRQPDALTEPLAERAASIIATYQGPVVFESFDPRQIVLIEKHGFGGPRGIITYAYDKPDDSNNLSENERTVLRDLTHAAQTRFDFISCFHEDVDLPAVRHWRAQGKPVTAWTIRSPAQAAAAAAHIDQIVFEGFDPDRA